ncbi:hypothetical protein BC828DRAFT_399564 [Blastocladiella britannica]|nr:hypothetical protein BC828DRAFT_399564 [Blastocladiella britannica]
MSSGTGKRFLIHLCCPKTCCNGSAVAGHWENVLRVIVGCSLQVKYLYLPTDPLPTGPGTRDETNLFGSLPRVNCLDEFENPYELLVAPLGGLSWIMSHARSTDPHVAYFGADLLQRAVGTHVPVDDALGHPGIGFGLVQALSHGAVSVGVDFWNYGGSDFLNNVATRCSQPLPDYDFESAATAVGTIYELAFVAEGITLGFALDFANAVVALCQQTGMNINHLERLVEQVLSRPNAAMMNVLFEQVDAPAMFATRILSPDEYGLARAFTFTPLFLQPNPWIPADTRSDLLLQCRRAIATVEGWDQLWSILAPLISMKYSVSFAPLSISILATQNTFRPWRRLLPDNGAPALSSDASTGNLRSQWTRRPV